MKPLAPFPDRESPPRHSMLTALRPVIDGHNDLAWTARETAAYSVENLEKDSIFQTDIDKLGRGGVGAQFWSVYTPCDADGARGGSVHTRTDRLRVPDDRAIPGYFRIRAYR